MSHQTYAERFARAEAALNIDPNIVQDLDEGQRLELTLCLVSTAVLLVGESSRVVAFDETTVAELEGYLLARHQHRVIKWQDDAGATPRRIFTESGTPSSSKAQIENYTRGLTRLGVVYAYCLAKCTGGRFGFDPEGNLQVVSPVPDISACYPVGKVFKFLKYGTEDSLVSFLNIVKRMPETDAAFHQQVAVLESMYEDLHGAALPAGHRVRRRHADDGALLGVTIFAADGTVLMQSELAE